MQNSSIHKLCTPNRALGLQITLIKIRKAKKRGERRLLPITYPIIDFQSFSQLI
jgi:hypothetical protein